LTLLRAGALAVRDLPIEARDSQFIWWFEIEVRSIGTARGSHPATIQGGGTNGWVNGQKLEHLPAGPVTLHFWRERTDGEMRHPAVPASGSYYRVDATVVAGQVTDVSIAPGH
jgi:hypothetical protein